MEKSERTGRTLIPIVDKRRLHKIGSAYAMFIPLKWFRAHNLNPDEIQGLLITGDLDIRIVNPLHEREVYDQISGVTKNAEVEKRDGHSNEREGSR